MSSPAAIQIKEQLQADYATWKENNSKDFYSKGVVDFAERWASLMEGKLAQGAELKNIAGDTSHEADTDGITGFMYGAAVAALSHFWLHGETLRKWHNKEYGHEGEGVVNPAVLTIKG